MAANSKYKPLATHEPVEEAASSYTQAPPSYQEEGILGAARTEYDNMPDDFKFGGVVAEATLDIRMQFVRKVYSIL
jgi:hypothetical protein